MEISILFGMTHLINNAMYHFTVVSSSDFTPFGRIFRARSLGLRWSVAEALASPAMREEAIGRRRLPSVGATPTAGLHHQMPQ